MLIIAPTNSQGNPVRGLMLVENVMAKIGCAVGKCH